MSRDFRGALPGITPRDTTDVDEYLEAWYKVMRPMEKYLGVLAAGFDSTVSYVDAAARPNYESVQLPQWFIRRINQLIKRYEALAREVTPMEDYSKIEIGQQCWHVSAWGGDPPLVTQLQVVLITEWEGRRILWTAPSPEEYDWNPDTVRRMMTPWDEADLSPRELFFDRSVAYMDQRRILEEMHKTARTRKDTDPYELEMLERLLKANELGAQGRLCSAFKCEEERVEGQKVCGLHYFEQSGDIRKLLEQHRDKLDV